MAEGKLEQRGLMERERKIEREQVRECVKCLIAYDCKHDKSEGAPASNFNLKRWQSKDLIRRNKCRGEEKARICSRQKKLFLNQSQK